MQLEDIRENLMECTDARVKAISEALNGIKAIKLYAWEAPWSERIAGLREQELVQIKRAALLSIGESLLWMAVCFPCPSAQVQLSGCYLSLGQSSSL